MTKRQPLTKVRSGEHTIEVLVHIIFGGRQIAWSFAKDKGEAGGSQPRFKGHQMGGERAIRPTSGLQKKKEKIGSLHMERMRESENRRRGEGAGKRLIEVEENSVGGGGVGVNNKTNDYIAEIRRKII